MRRSTAALALFALAAACCSGAAGCGGSADPVASAAELHPQAFAWLHPQGPPRRWRTTALPDGSARVAYPPGWHAINSDPGTVSAAAKAPGGKIVGYLNATPQQGDETLADWGQFRPAHNGDEGDVHIRTSASATGLRFQGGLGSCVIDTYTTSTKHRYREIACIVAGAEATTVVVGAAPPAEWTRQAPLIERAVSSFVT